MGLIACVLSTLWPFSHSVVLQSWKPGQKCEVLSRASCEHLAVRLRSMVPSYHRVMCNVCERCMVPLVSSLKRSFLAATNAKSALANLVSHQTLHLQQLLHCDTFQQHSSDPSFTLILCYIAPPTRKIVSLVTHFLYTSTGLRQPTTKLHIPYLPLSAFLACKTANNTKVTTTTKTPRSSDQRAGRQVNFCKLSIVILLPLGLAQFTRLCLKEVSLLVNMKVLN